jgi:hypothetical protein
LLQPAAMRTRRLPHLLILLLAAACDGQAADDALDPIGGKADDTSATCADTHLDSHGICRHANGTFAPKACCSASPLQQLASALEADGALVMPPPGVEFNASDMSSEVRIVEVADPDRLGDVITPLARDVAAEVDGESGDLLGVFQHPDDHFSLSGGFLDVAVRAALLADVSESARADVTARLDALPAFYGAHLETYDVGSEIVGRDLFVIAPFGGSQALVVIIRYFQG